MSNENSLSWISPNSDPDLLTFVDPGSSAPPVVFGSGSTAFMTVCFAKLEMFPNSDWLVAALLGNW